MKRRQFLTRGLAGVTGALALSQPGCGPGDDKRPGVKTKPTLVYRTLGKTGIKVPVIGMGTNNQTSQALVRSALNAGITHIATAPNYLRGKVESFVGEVIKDYRREDIVLATGVDPTPIDMKSGVYSRNTDTAKFERDFEGSLKRLGVDDVDILYLPFAAKKESVMFEPLMKVLGKIRDAGKARFLGVATHSHVPEAVRAAADSGFYDVVMLAYNFQIKDIEERKEAVAYAAQKGLGIVAMKTITGESWVGTNKQIAASNPKAALKWVLQDENIHTTVPGFTNFDQLETDLSVMEDLTLTPEEEKYLELARNPGKGGHFCQGCGSCLRQCASAPDVPTLMRCYMYVYGYRDLALAARHLERVDDATPACAGCASCKVECPMGIDIKDRVLDIIRLKNFPPEFFS